MSINFDKIKKNLSNRKITLVIILLAIASRVIQLIYFFNIRVDGMYQHMATLNFINGHGISTSYVLPADLSSTIYEPLINWPPGYSLLLAPFYLLFNHNYIAAGITLDILAAVTLIVITRKVLKLFETPVYLINIFTFLTSFCIYYFYFIASSDAIAISIFITGLYYTLSLFKTKKNWQVKTAGITISLILCAAIKYLFFPVVFIIPVYLIIKGFADKEIKFKKAGIYSFIITVLVSGALILYQKNISGSIAYISQPERGFFPEHVLSAYPYIPASFIKPETISLLFHLPLAIEIAIYRAFQLLHLILALSAIIFISKNIFNNRFRKLTLLSDYFYLVFFISLTIAIVLLTLSLCVAKEEILPGILWTYIEDPRYYGLIAVLIHIAVFILYSFYSHNTVRSLKYLFCFSLLLLLPEMFRGILFTGNRIKNLKKEEYSWQREDRFQKYAAAIIKKETKTGEKVIVTGSVYYMTGRISLYSDIAELKEVNEINNISIFNTKEPALLLIVLHEKDLNKFQSFLSQSENKFEGQFNGYYFFTFRITPH